LNRNLLLWFLGNPLKMTSCRVASVGKLLSFWMGSLEK